MNLQPLYDVKDRLGNAAIAGVGLLGEDFRLRRAAEDLKSLAAASPVFAKIDGGLQKLLTAPAEQRAGLLLDVLALVDAVAYTQAKTGGAGELEPLSTGGGVYRQISYGQISPILTALTTTGGGRMEIVRSAWENNPEFFSDFRVLPALVSGLGDGYGEIADQNAGILKKIGPAALPMLKQGFDPAGKKEMARRAEVISAIEGAEATPWLREILPQAKKDVRAAVILALGNDPDNTSLLLDLSKTERGGNREAVLEALAKQDGEEVQAFWKGEIAKNPGAVECLRLSDTEWASDLAAAAFRATLEETIAGGQVTYEELTALNRCRTAVLGKSSPAMLDCWRWIDGQLSNLGKLKRERGQGHVNLEDWMPSWLLDSLRMGGPGPLCGFCLELWERDRECSRYLPHAVLAALMTLPAAAVYDTFSPYIQSRNPLWNNEKKKALQTAVLQGLEYVRWDGEAAAYHIIDHAWHTQPIAQPLDPRWYDLLPRTWGAEKILRRIYRKDCPELCEKINAALFRAMCGGGHFIQEDVAFLRNQGWTQWKGFLNNTVRKDGSMTLYAAVRLLNETSLSDLEKAAELRELDRIVQERSRLTKRPSWPALAVQNQLASWEAKLNG